MERLCWWRGPVAAVGEFSSGKKVWKVPVMSSFTTTVSEVSKCNGLNRKMAVLLPLPKTQRRLELLVCLGYNVLTKQGQDIPRLPRELTTYSLTVSHSHLLGAKIMSRLTSKFGVVSWQREDKTWSSLEWVCPLEYLQHLPKRLTSKLHRTGQN